MLLKTLPQELQQRNQYLQENKELRQQHENQVDALTKWVKEAKAKLNAREIGVDFDNIMQELQDHKAYFNGNEKQIFGQLQGVKVYTFLENGMCAEDDKCLAGRNGPAL